MWIELLSLRVGDLFFALQELGCDASSVVEKDFGASIGMRAWRIVAQQERKAASASILRLGCMRDACDAFVLTWSAQLNVSFDAP